MDMEICVKKFFALYRFLFSMGFFDYSYILCIKLTRIAVSGTVTN